MDLGGREDAAVWDSQVQSLRDPRGDGSRRARRRSGVGLADEGSMKKEEGVET